MVLNTIVVKNLGVKIDSELSFQTLIIIITRVAFLHLRNISKLRKMLSLQDTEQKVHAFFTSCLDYYVLLSNSAVIRLQLVQNAAARVLTKAKKFEHISPLLKTLHWLPIKFRTNYNILFLTNKALKGLAPDLLIPYTPPRLLRY